MTKILVSADWHVNLHKKKVPYEWQQDRFRLFFNKLLELEHTHDIHIIAGDLFDRKPEPDELAIVLEYLHQIHIPTCIIPGNHEATKKGESFLSHYQQNLSINNPNVFLTTKNSTLTIQEIVFQLFPYGEMQLNHLPSAIPNSVLVTHIRGEVPPHISAEYDFEKLRPWKLVLLGDLHFHHQYQDFPAWYPGSPMNVSFDRDIKREYGVISIDYQNIDNYKVNFLPLNLPRLLRKTIKAGQELVKDDYNHVIYEVEGQIDELAKIENAELLDKKIVIRANEASKLNLAGLSLVEELAAWLEYSKVADKQPILDEFTRLNIQQ